MNTRALHLEAESLGLLHRDLIEDTETIREILARLKRDRVALHRGLTKAIDRESGLVGEIMHDRIVLDMRHFDRERAGQSFFSFELEDVPYFFEGVPVGDGSPTQSSSASLALRIPIGLYAVERRGLGREAAGEARERVRQVEIQTSTGAPIQADVVDWSYAGLAITVPEQAISELSSEVKVSFTAGQGEPDILYGEVRNRAGSERPGWVRLGLSVSQERAAASIAVERKTRIAGGAADRWRGRLAKLGAAGRIGARKALGRGPRPLASPLPVHSFIDDRGEEIVAYVDSVGDPKGAPAVLIPPAWGKTKETLLPLAETLLATFRRARQPLVVVRFDGVRRRGESHNDLVCRSAGRECEHFTVSQCVRDIRSVLDHLEDTYDTQRAMLVTFSASAVEGRRITATDSRIVGWVSVVGAADLQSALRVVSGGLDFPYGHVQGVEFGIQEIMGVAVDMDRVVEDGLEHGHWYAEDARRDMAQVTVPVTWICGRDDAWMDLDRARQLLSVGDASNRRLLEVPMGHQMRSSEMALDAFRLIASEISGTLLGKKLRAVGPDLLAFDARHRAERARVRKGAPDLKAFWHDYLLGRDRGIGIDLLASMSAYEDIMSLQVSRLELRAGDRVADLGAGTGSLVSFLVQENRAPQGVRITALDFVGDALQRVRDRARPLADVGGELRVIECDLDVGSAVRRIPLADASCDSVLASLLVSYLTDPEALLREAYRVLCPSGRLVVSGLRRDADTSLLYVSGVEELKAGRGRHILGEQTSEQVDAAARSFLNDAARLLDLEEAGIFNFYDDEELAAIVRKAGFREIVFEQSFGDPAQAVVVSATR